MKKFLILIGFALVMVACGGNEPLTVAQIQETRVAEATVIAEEAETAIQDRNDSIAARAPEGTVISETEPDRGHDQSINYPFEGGPLPGGVHNPSWQQCAAYDKPVAPQFAIHSMEHGGVWISYNPDDMSDSDVSRLESFTTGQPFVLVSPFPNQDSPIVVSAWGLQLDLDDANDGRIAEFITAFANGPQTPEPGANCRTGNSSTVDG